jgi:hypothetical protein
MGLAGKGPADHPSLFIVHQLIDINGLGKGNVFDQFFFIGHFIVSLSSVGLSAQDITTKNWQWN